MGAHRWGRKKWLRGRERTRGDSCRIKSRMSRTGNCYDNRMLEHRFGGSSRPRRCTIEGSGQKKRLAPPCSTPSKAFTTAGHFTPHSENKARTVRGPPLRVIKVCQRKLGQVTA